MSGPETTFYTGVHSILREEFGMSIDDMEKQHNAYVSGIWDVRYDGPLGELWVEYKFQPIPKRATTLWTPALSKLQAEWGNRKYLYGHKLMVVVGVENGRKAGGVVLATPSAWTDSYTAAAISGCVQPRRVIAAIIYQRIHG